MFGRAKGLELKSPAEIDAMRRAGAVLYAVLQELKATTAPGMATGEMDRLARARIKEAGGRPSFLGLYGFPGALCISVNEEVVHGIPSKSRVLKEGDIVSVDCGVEMGGFHTDSAITVAVGEISEQARDLMKVTQDALDRALEQCRPGQRLGDLGHAVQSTVEAGGFHVIEDYGGHGIGRDLHEDPKVDNFGQPGRGKRLLEGMVLAVEPMVGAGTGETEELEDGWTVVTTDRSLAAHFEHTVAVTAEGPLIITTSA